jgi:hypothetical protein
LGSWDGITTFDGKGGARWTAAEELTAGKIDGRWRWVVSGGHAPGGLDGEKQGRRRNR